MSNQLEKVKELIELRAQARLGGGEKAIEKTTRQRQIYSPASVLHSCLTKVVSKNWICLFNTVYQFRTREKTFPRRRCGNRLWNDRR